MHRSVCRESATALADPSSRPARRCAHDSTGMTTTLTATSAIPTAERSASPPSTSERTASTVT